MSAMELRSAVELECGWQSPCRWRGMSRSGSAPCLLVHSVDPRNRLGWFRACVLGEAWESGLRLARGCEWKWEWVLAWERAWVWGEGTGLVAWWLVLGLEWVVVW